MHKFFLCFILSFLLLVRVYAQNPTPCLTGPSQKFAKTGDLVTINWTMPDPLPVPNLLYFRIRCAQNISGLFVVCYQVPSNVGTYTFTFNKTVSTYYFLSAWYSVPQPDGSNLIAESEGSNMVRVRITK